MIRVAVLGYEVFADRTARNLRGEGVVARAVQARRRNSRGLGRIRQCRALLASDVIHVIGGSYRLGRLERPLAILGLPVVVHWVGSDVTEYGDRVGADIRRSAWNWAVSPWLAEELAPRLAGVSVVPLPCGHVPARVPQLPQQFTVLGYTPEDKPDVYGLEFILELARRMPDVRFELVATLRKESIPPNVNTLGWVENMDPVFRRASVLVRPVAHDGLSNMVQEALGYGRYALWSYSIPGVEEITTVDAAETYIRDLVERSATGSLEPNSTGRATIESQYHPHLVATRIKEGLEDVAERRWREPPGRIVRAVRTCLLFLLRLCFLVPRWPQSRKGIAALG